MNFAVSDGKIEPSVMSMMPNNKSPIHAAAKTCFLLYMV
jgi:hypothetical protein